MHYCENSEFNTQRDQLISTLERVNTSKVGFYMMQLNASSRRVVVIMVS